MHRRRRAQRAAAHSTESQRGLAAGTTDELVFGEPESAVRDFHAEIDRALGPPLA